MNYTNWRYIVMVFSRKKVITTFLMVSLIGGSLYAEPTDYLSQAKQKASEIRDWSAQVAQESYDKVSEKAHNAYAYTCEKTRGLYEKAKEHKKLIIGAAAYFMFEVIGFANEWRTPLYRLFVLPGELDAQRAANGAIPGLNTQITNLNQQLTTTQNNLNTVQNNLNTATNQTIPHLQTKINNRRTKLTNNRTLITQLNSQLHARNTHIVNIIDDLRTVDNNNSILTDRLTNAEKQMEQLNNLRKEDLMLINDLRNQLQETRERAQEFITRLEHDQEQDAYGFVLAMRNVNAQIDAAKKQIDTLQKALQLKENDIADYEKTAQEMVSELEQDLNEKQELNKQISQLIKQIEDLEKRYNGTLKNHQQEIQDLKDKQNSALQNQIDVLKQEHAATLQELNNQHQKALQEARTQHSLTTKQIDALKSAQQQEKELLKKQYEQNVNSITTTLKNDHQKQIRELGKKYNDKQKEITDLANESHKRQEEINKKNQEIKALNQKRDQEVEKLEEQKRQFEIKNAADKAKIELQMKLAIEQGKVQAQFDHKHTTIVTVLDNLDREIQEAVHNNQYEPIDAIGIITDLMTQAHELIYCRDTLSAAYPNELSKQAEVAKTFNRIHGLTKQTINHTIHQIQAGAQWLVNGTRDFENKDINAHNFDEQLAPYYADIHNYFTQLKGSINQLARIVSLNKNPIIQNCLGQADSAVDPILQSLAAMLTNSFEKIQQLMRSENDKPVADSYKDAFSIYVHGLVARCAYESYIDFGHITEHGSEYEKWAKCYEEGIAFIVNCITQGTLCVKDAGSSVNLDASIMSESSFLKELGNSVLLQSNLSNSSIKNFNVDSFLNRSMQSSHMMSSLKDSLVKSYLGSSFFGTSSLANKSDDLDALLKSVIKQDADEWQQELGDLNKSAIDWQKSQQKSLVDWQESQQKLSLLTSSFFTNSTNNMAMSQSGIHGKSTLGSSSLENKSDDLDVLLNSISGLGDSIRKRKAQKWQQELEDLNKSSVDWQKSQQKSVSTNNMATSQSGIHGKSILGASSIGSSTLDQTCPFVASQAWGSKIEALANSNRFKRLAGSRVANFAPLGNKANIENSSTARVITNKVMRPNVQHAVNDSLINNVSNILTNTPKQTNTNNDNLSNLTYSALAAEFGNSTTFGDIDPDKK
jgi:hypothetical protein